MILRKVNFINSIVLGFTLLSYYSSFAQINSTKSGDWSDTGLWSSSTIPAPGANNVFVQHSVNLNYKIGVPAQGGGLSNITGFHQAFRNGTIGTCNTNSIACWCPFGVNDSNNNCTGILVRQGGNYMIGKNSSGSVIPSFSGTISSTNLIVNVLQVNLNTSFDSNVLSGSFFQVPTSGSGPTFGSSASYFNPIVGQINSVNGQSLDLLSGFRFEPANGLIYSASILRDPVDAQNSFATLVAEGSANKENDLTDNAKLARITFGNGITQFDGGALLREGGTVTVQNNATLILGPIKCRVCDINDPAYNQTQCNLASNNDCRVDRLVVNNYGRLIINPGGRVIVYGNIKNNYSAGNQYSGITVDGGLYVVGSLDLTNSTITSTSGQTSGNYTGDIYTTGTIVVNNSGGATELFGEPAAPCTTGPCVATQVLCGWGERLSVSGIIPYCSSTAISSTFVAGGSLTSNSTVNYIWQEYDPNAATPVWVNKSVGSGPGVYPNFSISNPLPGKFLNYRLMAYTGSLATPTCSTFTTILQVSNNNATINTWIGDRITGPTSVSSVAIGTGSKIFTITGLSGSYVTGEEVLIYDRTNSNNWMRGVVSGSNATSVTINVTSISGSGTISNWALTPPLATSWGQNRNWCFNQPGLPTAEGALPVLIETNVLGVYPSFDLGTAVNISSLTLNTNTKLNLTSGNLGIGGNLTLTGIAQLNASGTNTVTFTGANSSIILNSIATGSNLQFRNLTIANGASLSLPAGPLMSPAPSTIANEIKISGNLLVNGTLNGNCRGCFVTSSKSRLIFNGAGVPNGQGIEQTVTSAGISSINMDDVHLLQTGGSSALANSIKLMGSNFNLFGKLTFETGSITDLKSLNTGVSGKLVLKSVSPNYLYNSSVGIIPGAGLSNGSKISGTVRAERFVPNYTSFSGSLFRYFASPVKSSVFPSEMGTRYIYDKSLTDNTMTRYVSTSSLPNPSLMIGGRGYAVSYRNINTNKAWFVEGELNQGTQKILCPTGCVEPGYKGWHLIGNPFPHPIKWASYSDNSLPAGQLLYGENPPKDLKNFGEGGGIASANGSAPETPTVLKPGISRIISVRDVTGSERSRQYLALPGPIPEQFWGGRTIVALQAGTCTYCFNGVLDIGQSFWVYSYGSGDGLNNSSGGFGFPVSDQDASLWITEDAKNIGNTAPTFYNRQISQNSDIKTLTVILSDGLTEDVAFQSFNKNKKSENSPRFVVPKIPTLESEIHFLDEARGELLLNEIGEIDDSLIIPLGYTATEPGNYFLKFEMDSLIRFDAPLFLVDNFLGVITPIDDPQGYRFYAEKPGKVNDRFFLTARPEFEKREYSVAVTPNPVSDKFYFKVYNFTGISLLSVADNNGRKLIETKIEQEGEIVVSGLPNGMYFVNISNSEGDRVVKIIKNAAN